MSDRRCLFCAFSARRRGLCWSHYRKLNGTAEFPGRLRTGPQTDLAGLRHWAESFTAEQRVVLIAALTSVGLSAEQRERMHAAMTAV